VSLALLGAGRRLAPGRSVVTWEAEHQAVLGAVRQLQLEGHPVRVLPVDSRGAAVAAINIRCLEGVELEKIPVTHFDGRSK